MKINILDSTRNDLTNGYQFYEEQESGLGIYFLESLFSDIDSLKIHAGVHEIYFEKFFRLLSKRFPFAIYYRIENKEILVYAVLDCRMNPTWIRSHLR